MELAIQIILASSVMLLTLVFFMVGVWVFLILKDIRRATKRVGEIGDNINETSILVRDKVKESLNIAGVIAALATLWEKNETVRDMVKDKLHIRNKESTFAKASADKQGIGNNQEEEYVEEIYRHPKPAKRAFFKRKN